MNTLLTYFGENYIIKQKAIDLWTLTLLGSHMLISHMLFFINLLDIASR